MFQIDYICSIPSSAENQGYFSAKEEGQLRSDELKRVKQISLQSVILPFVKQSQPKVRWEGLGVHILKLQRNVGQVRVGQLHTPEVGQVRVSGL